MIANIWNDIHRRPQMHACILIGLIPCPPKGDKNIEEAWHSPAWTLRSQYRNLDITERDFKLDYADGFQR